MTFCKFSSRGFLLASALILTACGGGAPQPHSQDQIFIAGGGIKGPLAFASVELYKLDTQFNQLYDKNAPLAVATTNAYAEITDLAVPANVPPPYILIVGGANAIDRNTDVPPVIKTLVTIVTADAIAARQPVYATPYTTLAYHLLRQGVDDGSYRTLESRMNEYNGVVGRALGFGMPAEINIFTTPPIIDATTTSVDRQQLVVEYRAAIEALSGLLEKMSSSSDGLSADELLRRLAKDLYSDGIVNNAANGKAIGGIDIGLLTQDPMPVEIPNTNYLVRDIVALIDDERALVGSGANIEFYKDKMVVSLMPATLMATALTVSSPAVGGGVIFSDDFNNEPLHTYTADDIRSTWNGASGAPKTDAVKIVKDPDPSGSHGNVMQVFYAADSYIHQNNSGARWQMDIGSHDDLYFAYDVYFEPDAEFVRGGKLPGLSSVGVYSDAGVRPDGTDSSRWTGTLMWHENGEIRQYVYHANQPGNYGQNMYWNQGPNGQVYFQRGKWNRVEMHYKMNTPGVLDGSLQAWFNGVKVLDTNSIMYRMPGGENLKIGTLQFLSFYGGSDMTWAPSTDQHIYFDNFVISTKPITH